MTCCRTSAKLATRAPYPLSALVGGVVFAASGSLEGDWPQTEDTQSAAADLLAEPGASVAHLHFQVFFKWVAGPFCKVVYQSLCKRSKE